MSAPVAAALAFVVTTAIVTAAIVSCAVADPEGWAAWRVALAAWPVGATFGALAAWATAEELGRKDTP